MVARTVKRNLLRKRTLLALPELWALCRKSERTINSRSCSQSSPFFALGLGGICQTVAVARLYPTNLTITCTLCWVRNQPVQRGVAVLGQGNCKFVTVTASKYRAMPFIMLAKQLASDEQQSPVLVLL